MAWQDWGNAPINGASTGFAPVSAPSTATLLYELDSTQLGTVNFRTGQKQIVQVKWILGADTNVTWQCEMSNSTNLNAGVDIFYPKTITGQSAEYITEHELQKDYRLRARLFSTGANAAAWISAMPWT
jgi:hypothetical protein